MIYPVKSPFWFRLFYPHRVWHIPGNEKTIYLTFDDGPDPEVTGFVLDELDKFNAKASFFCIGRNVEQHPEMYRQLLSRGHAVGNHTYDHCNGWKTEKDTYIASVQQAGQLIESPLFRPPYGRLKSGQAKALVNHPFLYQLVMWSVLSGDFDISISPEKCCENVISNTGAGDIVVFHDSRKAFARLQYALPRVLEHFSAAGYRFEKLGVKKIKK